MSEPSRFVYIVDRYLEVSNVYHQRMKSDAALKAETSNFEERVQRLLAQVEGAATQKTVAVQMIEHGQEKGQIVAPTKSFLENLAKRQNDVFHRLNKMPAASPVPRNFQQLRSLLKLKPQEFLGSFPTPSYASDILSELASLSVCPDVTILAARDMIHMHCVELQLHLVRIIAQVRLSATEGDVPVSFSFPVDQLRKMTEEGTIVEKLIEFAVPREPDPLFTELRKIVTEPTAAVEFFEANESGVHHRLLQETRAFPDTLEILSTAEGSIRVCEELVLFGLVATYAAWFSNSQDNEGEMGSFRTNILFCTRILLDEGRWWLCREFAKFARDAILELNSLTHSDAKQGTGMINANLFFSRRMAGEELDTLRAEISEWDITGLHARYQFLRHILLEQFDDALKIAKNLVKPSKETEVPDLSKEELCEWPILADFRSSKPGSILLKTFGCEFDNEADKWMPN